MTKGQETKGAILDEALALASRVGFTGLTIGQLAEQTGMSKSGLFAHFRSKEQLQLQTLAHAATRFIDTTVRPTLAAPRGETRLRELFDRWLDLGDRGAPGRLHLRDRLHRVRRPARPDARRAGRRPARLDGHHRHGRRDRRQPRATSGRTWTRASSPSRSRA